MQRLSQHARITLAHSNAIQFLTDRRPTVHPAFNTERALLSAISSQQNTPLHASSLISENSAIKLHVFKQIFRLRTLQTYAYTTAYMFPKLLECIGHSPRFYVQIHAVKNRTLSLHYSSDTRRIIRRGAKPTISNALF